MTNNKYFRYENLCKGVSTLFKPIKYKKLSRISGEKKLFFTPETEIAPVLFAS